MAITRAKKICTSTSLEVVYLNRAKYISPFQEKLHIKVHPHTPVF